MPRTAPALLALSLGALAATGTGAAEAGAERVQKLSSEFHQQALVRRVEWPVRFVPKKPGGCGDLRADQVVVREDGVEIVPDGLERTPLATIHGVLIDVSGSMEVRLGRARKAARDYIRSLPGNDEVLLATFSDNLVLHAPLTRDRDRVERALDEIEVHAATAFNDALHYLGRYLASRPERKIIVVLTDGCDSASLPGHAVNGVIDMIEQIQNLTVYPIGIDLPGSCSPLPVNVGPADGPAVVLERLARRSGGRLFRTRESAAIDDIFRAIRARTEREGFVSYRPIPFGDGRKDRPERRTERRRRVRVEAPGHPTCRVESAGPERRLESRELREGGAVGAAADPLRPALGDRLTFDDGGNGDAETGPAWLQLGDDAIRGRATDILHERSRLYAPLAYWTHGKYYTVWDGRPRLGRRDFELRVPRFDVLRHSLTSPAALMMYLLEFEREPFRPPQEPRGRRDAARRELGPLWIHGQTLIELRAMFARGLFGYDGYREFAVERIREEYRAEMERKLTASSLLADLPEDQRSDLHELIDRLQPEPRPGQLQRYLAEWLGDISAYELVVGFEGWAANFLLAAGLDDQRASHLLVTVDARWNELGRWFPPPTQVRIITPLVPAYDAERDVVGFYRVLLPKVAWLGPPADIVPPSPLGLTFIRRYLESAPGRRSPAVAQIADIGYDYPSRQVRRRMVRGARKQGLVDKRTRWREVPMVHLGLAGEGAELSCTVLFEPPDLFAAVDRSAAPTPLCIDLAGTPAAMTSRLADALLDVAPRCAVAGEPAAEEEDQEPGSVPGTVAAAGFSMSSSSTSKTIVAPGRMLGGEPRSP